MAECKSGIYLIKCLTNGKIYVGQAQDIQGRLKQHRVELKNRVHINRHLQNAFNKYGRKSFVFEPHLYEPDLDKLEDLEDQVGQKLREEGIELFNIKPFKQDVVRKHKMSEEDRKYRSEIQRKLFSDPEFVARIQEASRKAVQSQKYRDKAKQRALKQHKDLEMRQNFLAAIEKRTQDGTQKRVLQAATVARLEKLKDPEYREKNRVRQQEVNNRVEVKIRRGEAIRKAHEDRPEIKEKLRKAALKQHSDPTFKDFFSRLMKASHNTPEARKNISEGVKKRYELDPEYRKKISETQKKRLSDPLTLQLHRERLARVHKLKSLQRLPQEKRDEICRRYQAGETDAALSREFKLDRISDILKENGIKIRTRKETHQILKERHSKQILIESI